MRDLLDKTLAMKRSGHSWRDIGEAVGMSHETIRQLASNYEYLQPNLETMLEWIQANAPVSRSIVIERFDLTEEGFRLLPHLLPEGCIAAEAAKKHLQFSDGDMIDALRRGYAELVRIASDSPTGLSLKAYTSLATTRDPSASAIMLRYKSWSAACEAAGVPCSSPPASRVYRRKWEDDDLLVLVGEFLEECLERNERPTYLAYDRWQRQDAERPSGALIRNRLTGVHGRFAGWSDVVSEASKRIDR